MIDLNKNPFFDQTTGKPIPGKEYDFLSWNNEARNKTNPFLAKDGTIVKDKHSEFGAYAEKIALENQKDLLLLPEKIRLERLESGRNFRNRMQAEVGY